MHDGGEKDEHEHDPDTTGDNPRRRQTRVASCGLQQQTHLLSLSQAHPSDI